MDASFFLDFCYEKPRAVYLSKTPKAKAAGFRQRKG
jgi:hypothetical protein